MASDLRYVGAPARGALLATLLDHGPRTENRTADTHVCRAGRDRLLQVTAHPRRDPGGVGVVAPHLGGDVGETGERGEIGRASCRERGETSGEGGRAKRR